MMCIYIYHRLNVSYRGHRPIIAWVMIHVPNWRPEEVYPFTPHFSQVAFLDLRPPRSSTRDPCDSVYD